MPHLFGSGPMPMYTVRTRFADARPLRVDLKSLCDACVFAWHSAYGTSLWTPDVPGATVEVVPRLRAYRGLWCERCYQYGGPKGAKPPCGNRAG